MNKPRITGFCSVAFGLGVAVGNLEGAVVDYANPMIGTDAHGHTYPGAAVPFGFVQVSPDSGNRSWDAKWWDGCSGYHYSDTNLVGFSFNHLTGTGCPDLGNILLLPTVGNLKLSPGDEPSTRFFHDQEEARPGYYRVFLPDYKVHVELTATTRVGMQRYTFPETVEAHVVLDLWHGVGSQTTDAMLTIENDHTISGYRKETGTSCFQDMGLEEYYFVAEFSEPFASSGVCLDGKEVASKEVRGRDLKAHFDYKTRAGEKLVVRVGLSTVSVEGARIGRASCRERV